MRDSVTFKSASTTKKNDFLQIACAHGRLQLIDQHIIPAVNRKGAARDVLMPRGAVTDRGVFPLERSSHSPNRRPRFNVIALSKSDLVVEEQFSVSLPPAAHCCRLTPYVPTMSVLWFYRCYRFASVVDIGFGLPPSPNKIQTPRHLHPGLSFQDRLNLQQAGQRDHNTDYVCCSIPLSVDGEPILASSHKQ